MSTKTMRLPPRRVITPSNKRKEREGPEALPPPSTTKPSNPTTTQSQAVSETALPNQLIACYLAHEFLTNGTLFGQPWDSGRAEASHASSTVTNKKGKPTEKSEAEPTKGADMKIEKLQRYVEVANLLKEDGTQLPGIVNPTQLAQFLQL